MALYSLHIARHLEREQCGRLGLPRDNVEGRRVAHIKCKEDCIGIWLEFGNHKRIAHLYDSDYRLITHFAFCVDNEVEVGLIECSSCLTFITSIDKILVRVATGDTLLACR